MLADRVGVVEGYVEDLSRGHVPNVFAERGWKAEWKHNRKSLVTRVAVGAVLASAAVAYLSSRRDDSAGERSPRPDDSARRPRRARVSR